jgi:uncharacterized Zn finger protein
LPTFDVDALRRIAGEKVFARGVSYCASGQVAILAIDGKRIIAEVYGSDLYRAELIADNRKISGFCSCPAFADWGFCKHLVATALSVNSLAPEELSRAAGCLPGIRARLNAEPIESLIEIIMRLAEHDADLLKALAAWADDHNAKVLQLARPNESLDDAAPNQTHDEIDTGVRTPPSRARASARRRSSQ